MKNLEKLFSYEFKVIFYQITEPVQCEIEFSSNSRTLEGFRKNKKDNYNRGKDDDGGNSNGGGSDDDGDASINNDKKVILVAFRASAKSEDYSHIQKFDINLCLHAEINKFSEIPKFFINIDVCQCETNVTLSKIWKALSSVSQGYSLESIKIIISPINDDPDYEFALVTRDYYHPREKNTPIKYTENVE